jgi:TPR repeat protein
MKFLLLFVIFVFFSACTDVSDPKIFFDKGEYKKAYNLWLPLANKGDLRAQNYIGIHHYLGLGTKRDYKPAKEWFEKAAKQGSANAQYNLGVMYENGEFVKQDYMKAAMWFSIAIENGNEKARRRVQSILDGHRLFPNQYTRAKELAKQYR